MLAKANHSSGTDTMFDYGMLEEMSPTILQAHA